MSPELIYAIAVGAIIGSFLNVVVLSLPLWLFPELRPVSGPGSVPEKLMRRSRCPSCGHTISAWENMPVLSWFLLRGRCSSCRSIISVRYPLVEFVTAVLTAFVVHRFGVTLESLAGCFFLWLMLPLALIDLDHKLLPDALIGPLVLLGIGQGYLGLHTNLVDSMLGLTLGTVSLLLLNVAGRLLLKKDGIGAGDMKLFGAIGAWVGVQGLPQVWALAFVTALLGALVLSLFKGRLQRERTAFGPYLIFGGLFTFLLGIFFGFS